MTLGSLSRLTEALHAFMIFGPNIAFWVDSNRLRECVIFNLFVSSGT